MCGLQSFLCDIHLTASGRLVWESTPLLLLLGWIDFSLRW